MQGMQALEAEFWRRLSTAGALVQQYEEPSLQAQALACMPAAFHPAPGGGATSAEGRDELLLRLLDWFKSEFFTWVDAPPCSACGGSTGTRVTHRTIMLSRW